MLYIDLLKRLYAINSKKHSKYDLANMRRLSSLFSHPEKKYPTIHVAGSNGKGSVTTKIAKALELSGLIVGLYTSPHISTFRVRIKINGKMISEDDVEVYLSTIFSVIDQEKLSATFFEITTLLAFRYFAECEIDIAVIETGLGGRLDATNIIHPQLSVITTLSLEHTSILGKSLPEIAREKAGIIKPNVPVVLGPKVPVELIAPFASKLKSPCIPVKGTFLTFDAENSATAEACLAYLKVPANCIFEGCKVRPSCRMEKVDLKNSSVRMQPEAIILDVAHNPEGLDNLFTSIKKLYPHSPLRILCGFSSDKEIPACVTLLKTYGSAFHLVQSKSSRALSCQDLYKEFIAQEVPEDQLFLADTLEDNLDLALQMATQKHEILIICGTFYIMSQVRAFLGIVEATDPFELNEGSVAIRL
jgi:dihydrofolate synthase/folylpolyglutamate synthase